MGSGDADNENNGEDIAGIPVLRVAYYVITRFNLYKREFREKLSDSDYERWCKIRAKMLMNITAQSLIYQQIRSFRWLILCDVEVNATVEAMISEVKTIPFAEIVFIDLRGKTKGAMQGAISDHIKQALPRRYTHVSTTRLDSDDAIHTNFIRSLRYRVSKSADLITSKGLVRVQFPYVMTWNGSQFRVGQYPRGHFATLVEPHRRKEALKTIYFAKHTIKMANELYILNKFPAALTCIHGGNVWNTFNDDDLVVVDNGGFLREFGIDEGLARDSLCGK